MARREALVKLHQRLIARRDTLHRVLAGELNDMRGEDTQSGDAADVAFGTGAGEIASQLAEFEARELAQIERAVKLLKSGKYGTCEACGKKIPVARLNALPYSTHCIECQRQQERLPFGDRFANRGDWGRVRDANQDEPQHIDHRSMDYDPVAHH